ncbi:MAG: hypothetical protein KDJ35_03945 [Alphaproteobacteria bacterium]|nr:hypothetical protein [Alphaproteobacteria bacterium]
MGTAAFITLKPSDEIHIGKTAADVAANIEAAFSLATKNGIRSALNVESVEVSGNAVVIKGGQVLKGNEHGGISCLYNIKSMKLPQDIDTIILGGYNGKKLKLTQTAETLHELGYKVIVPMKATLGDEAVNHSLIIDFDHGPLIHSETFAYVKSFKDALEAAKDSVAFNRAQAQSFPVLSRAYGRS